MSCCCCCVWRMQLLPPRFCPRCCAPRNVLPANKTVLIVVDSAPGGASDAFNMTLQMNVSRGAKGGGGPGCTRPSRERGADLPPLLQPALPGQTFDNAIDLGSNVTASVSSSTAPYLNLYESFDCVGSGPDVVSRGVGGGP